MRSPLYDIYDPYGILDQQARAGMLPDDEGMYRRRQATLADLMPPEEKSSLMGDLANRGMSMLSGLGWLLDTPGAAVRGTISGLMEGDPLKGIRSIAAPSDERVTGRDLLRQAGLVGDDDTVMNWLGGLAGEIALDPLTYANPLAMLGRGAYTAAGRAASKTSLLDNAAVLARREGMGPREFLRSRTARQLLDATPEASRGRLTQEFADAAAGRGYAAPDLLDQPLTGMMGVRIPGTEIGTTFSGGAVGDAVARGLDSFGEGLKTFPLTGPVVNRLTRNFDPSVMGRLDPNDQWRAREAFYNAADLERGSRGDLGAQLWRAGQADTSALPEGLRDFNSDRIQNAIRDTIEAQLDPERMTRLFDQEAVRAIDAVPEWSQYRSWYRQTLADAQARRAELGLATPHMQSMYGTGYVPRQIQQFANEDLPTLAGRNPREVSQYNRGQRVYTTDDLVGRGRRGYTDIEGGAETFRRLGAGDLGARLRGVGDDAASGMIDDAFAQLGLERPYERLASDTGETMQSLREFLQDTALSDVERAPAQRMLEGLESQARSMKVELADLFRQGDNQFVATGRGFFDGHTASDMLRYGAGGARSEANAPLVIDSLLRASQNVPAGSVPGGGAVPLLQAATDLGFDRNRIRDILSARLPGVNLDAVSVPETIISELGAIAGRTAADATSPMSKLWNSYTSAFKIGALANPAYHTRNLYSGFISSLSSGDMNPLSALRSWSAGLQAGRGEYGQLINRLRDAPAFRGLADDQILSQFMAGAARNPLGQGLISEADNVLASAGDNLLPGADQAPDLMRAFYTPGRSWTDWLRDFTTVRGVDFGTDQLLGGRQGAGWLARNAPAETRNPLLMLHELAGRRGEDANRLGTYIEMLRQGASPDAAAARVFKTQVDYSPRAFTDFERGLKQYVPFYSYTRGIAPLIGENLLYRPGGLQGQTTRAIADLARPQEDTFIPEHLRSTASVAVPGEYGDEGQLRRFVTNIDVPWADAVNLISPGVGNTATEKLLSSIQQTGLNLAGMTNPLIKTPLELLLNRQLYSGREMSDLYSWMEERGVPQGRILEQIATALPGGTKANAIARTLIDPRLSGAEKASKLAINNLLGVKVTDIDQEKTRTFAARQMLTDLLKSSPGVRSYENLSVPDDVLATLPEEQRRMYLAYRILQSEAAKRARQRKAAASDPVQAILSGVR
jgi:hypothetical protein